MAEGSSEYVRDIIKIGKLNIAYQHKGKGKPLVLLHGALSDSRVWRRQIAELSELFEIVAWDAPGCGRSSDPPEDFTLSDYAECLAEFIKIVGLKNPHILGLSFGAGLALEFYRCYPENPRTLVLASAYAGWAGSLPPEVVEERRQKAIELADMPLEIVISSWLPSFFAESVTKDVIEETIAIMSDYHPIGARVMANAFAEADLRGMLPTINIPTLLLFGGADQRTSIAIAEDLHSKIPKSKLVIIPGAGHDLNLEVPEIFNKEVHDFLLFL